MGDLVLKGSTSGQITVTPTAVAGTNTLTLPAKTGNIITSADSGTVTSGMLASGAVTSSAIASGAITTAALPAGTILQVQSFNYGTSISTSSTSDVATGLTVSITPTKSTSKIYIVATMFLRATAAAASNCFVYVKLRKDPSTILVDGYAIIGSFGQTDIRSGAAITYLDSPATTSSVTYTMLYNSSLAGTVYMNATSNPSNITVFEVAQ